uniref:SWIM-type domain-containing protein n=1 Tax=Amphimedon queenslandica TaxID=400682 RepID=A0A1X7SHI9_AMPQE
MEESYKKKLKLIFQGLSDLCDPYKVPMEMWSDDISLWPDLEFGQLYMYLVSTTGEFTKEMLKNYKSLDAYNYYASGWVQTIYFHDMEQGINCVLKGKVKASQRLNDPPHEAWVCLHKKTADVVTGHCSCMAGKGGTCSHVAGILFKIEACARLGIVKMSCTSLPCVWNQSFSKN